MSFLFDYANVKPNLELRTEVYIYYEIPPNMSLKTTFHVSVSLVIIIVFVISLSHLSIISAGIFAWIRDVKELREKGDRHPP